MRRLVLLVLSISLALTACTQPNDPSVAPSPVTTQTVPVESPSVEASFTGLDDPGLLSFVEDSVYEGVVDELGSGSYFVENIEAVYVSKEYLEESAYNSQKNIYFGHTLSELEKQFQGTKFVFTLDEDGQTSVREFEKYDDTFDQVVRNVAIGTGVILLCVTVSVATGGPATAVGSIFAVSAKTAAIAASSGGLISALAAGVITGFETRDFDETLKAAALAGSDGFVWGAITGAVTGGAGQAIALRGATLNGLTMNQAAAIQRESKYPLDVIKSISSMDEYAIYKKADVHPMKIKGHNLVRNIDPDFVSDGLTNLERISKGMAPRDPLGKAYELHHVGQQADSPLAVLTIGEHRLGNNYSILHPNNTASTAEHGAAWTKQTTEFWKECFELKCYI